MRERASTRASLRLTGLPGLVWSAVLLTGAITLTAPATGRCAATQAASALLRYDSATVIGNGSRGPYWFTGYFVIRGSVQVSGGGVTLVPGEHYVIDHNNGRLLLAEPLGSEDSVTIDFQHLSWSLPTKLSLTGAPRAGFHGTGTSPLLTPELIPVSVITRESLPASGPRLNRLPAPPATSQIRWEGFKSLSFSASRAGASSWSQGLELSVDGDLAEGLKLRAAVSDRATPGRNRRGSSAVDTRLGDLDRLLIEARSKRFFGRWGEIVLEDAANPNKGRHASGLALRWGSAGHQLGGQIARVHGRRIERQLTLRSGDAGPYRISRTPSGADIVQGTLEILFDGRRLTDGRNGEYTIDVPQGTITFAPSVAVTSHSICVVVYEEALGGYQRSLAGGSWSTENADASRRHRTSVRWEGDDPSAPLFGILSDAERAQLADDRSGSITMSAAEWAGDRGGDYRLDTAGGDSIFVYTGPENGDWRVRFEWVGPGLGRYRHLAEAAYEYVGPNRGAYEPRRTLSAPAAHVTVDESFAVDAGKAGRFVLDWRGVMADPNRLTAGDKSFSSRHHLGWTVGRPSATGEAAGFSWGWNRLDRTLADGWTPGATLEQFTRRWRLRPSIRDTSHTEHTVMFSQPVREYADLAVEAGILRGSDVSVWRGQARSTLRMGPHLGGEFSWTHRRAARAATQDTGDNSDEFFSAVTVNPGPAKVEMGWRESDYQNPGGMFASEVRYAATRWIAVSGEGATLRHRWERSLDTLGLPTQRLRELSLDLSSTLLRAVSGIGLTVARGTHTIGGQTPVPYYRGGLHAEWRPFAGAAIRADMQLTRGSGGAQREVFLPARVGHGQYRFERGEYIPDPQGDFRRVLVDDPADGRTTAYDGSRRLSVRWRAKVLGWRMALESRRETKGRYAPRQFRPGLWLTPWSDLDRALLPGAQWMSGDYHLLTVHPDQATEIRVKFVRDRRVVRSGASESHAGRQVHRLDTDVRLRRRLGRGVFAEGRTSFERNRRNGETVLPLAASAFTHAIMLGTVAAVGPGGGALSASGSIEARRRRDREEWTRRSITLWGIRPTVRAHWGPVQLNLKTDATWVSAEGADQYLSPLLAEGRPLHFSLTETAELRWQLPGRVTLKARAFADYRQDGANRWRMEIETVARF